MADLDPPTSKGMSVRENDHEIIAAFEYFQDKPSESRSDSAVMRDAFLMYRAIEETLDKFDVEIEHEVSKRHFVRQAIREEVVRGDTNRSE